MGRYRKRIKTLEGWKKEENAEGMRFGLGRLILKQPMGKSVHNRVCVLDTRGRWADSCEAGALLRLR